MKKYNITAICALASSLLIGSSCLAMNNQPSYYISPLDHDNKIAWIQTGINKDDYILVQKVISNYVGYGTDKNLYCVLKQLSSASNLIYMDYRILRNQALSRILDNKTLLNENLLKILKELTMREVTSIQIGSQEKFIGKSLVNEVYKGIQSCQSQDEEGIQSCQSQDKVRKVLSTILDSFPTLGDRMIFVQNLLNKAQANNDQKTIENLFFAIEENRLTNEENAINNFIDYKQHWFQKIVEAYVKSTLLEFPHPDRPYFFLKTYFPLILNNNLNHFLIETISTNNSSALFLIEKPIPANILCWAIENFKENYNPEVAYKILPEEILKSCVSCVEITSMEEVSYISAYLDAMERKNLETHKKALQIIKNNPILYNKLCYLWNLYKK